MNLALDEFATAPVGIALQTRHMCFCIEVVLVRPVRSKRERLKLPYDVREHLARDFIFFERQRDVDIAFCLRIHRLDDVVGQRQIARQNHPLVHLVALELTVLLLAVLQIGLDAIVITAHPDQHGSPSLLCEQLLTLLDATKQR
ncbi:hypothetical protein [Paraburkholderia phymatum]|uniref:hypothetical protein n=1 Tax=Paraburkholderia phymatum TaxID=148447 RepID=UPI003D17284E